MQARRNERAEKKEVFHALFSLQRHGISRSRIHSHPIHPVFPVKTSCLEPGPDTRRFDGFRIS
jgi:hypothetical protein